METHKLHRFTATLFVLIALITPLHAAEQFSGFIRLGHADEQLDGYDNSVNSGQDPALKRSVAIYLPAHKMAPCKGNSITEIQFAIAQSVYFSDEGLKMFITKDLNGPYDYEQKVTQVVSMWNQVVLETPFPVDGEGVYIGYEYYASNKSGISRLTPNTDVSADWCFRGGEWVKSQNSSALAIQGFVKGEHLPQYNIALDQTGLVTYAELGKNMNVSGTFTNLGTATLHRFDVNYRLNGGVWVSQTVDGVEIPYESSYRFETNHLVLPATGEYTVEISVDGLNGQQDIDPSDNVSKAYTVGCVDAFTPRNLLLELFTTENCPNCPEGLKHIESLVGNNSRVCVVEHHSGFGKDDYTIQESLDYEWFYNRPVSAPSVMLDRRNLTSYSAGLPANSPVFGAGSLTAGLVENSLNIPAFATLGLKVEYNETTREAKIHVEGKRLLPLPGTDSRIFVYLTENNIFTAKQSGSMGSFYHQHLIRRVLTGTWGDPADLSGTFSADYSTILDDSWNYKEMQVVAFVSGYNSEEVNQCTVYNSAQTLLYDDGTSVSSQTVSPVTVSLNGKTIGIDGAYDRLDLFDLSGRCVRQSRDAVRELPAEDLPGGVYLLRIRKQDGNQTCKIVLPE